MNRTLGIGAAHHVSLTKRELIDLINATYPDDKIHETESICRVITCENYANEITQSICFSTILKP